MPSNFMERRDVIPLAIIPHFVRGNLAPVPFVDESVVEHIDVLRAGFAQGPQNSFEPVGSREEEVVVARLGGGGKCGAAGRRWMWRAAER